MLIGEVDREIIGLFSEDIAAYYSINKIAKKLGKKYPYINKRVSSLLEQAILKKSVLGNTYLCSINFGSDSAVAMLSLVEIDKRNSAATKNERLGKLLEQIRAKKREVNIGCAVISGTRLILVGQDRIVSSDSLSLKGYSYVCASRKDFLKMLCEEGVVKDHVILYGFERYFEMVGEVEKELRAQQLREIA
jgi:DNA-binding Lrp family transcriptional regulator